MSSENEQVNSAVPESEADAGPATKEMSRPSMKPLKDAGLVFHGLRKSAVVFLLEAGCTDAEVSAITGQSRQMIEHYARQVNQRKLAASAILKWEAAGSGRTEAEQHL